MVFASSYHNIASPLGFTSSENYSSLTAGALPFQKLTFPFSDEVFCVAKISDAAIGEAFSEQGNPDLHTRLEKLSILSIADVLQQSGIRPNDPELGFIYTTTKGNIDLLDHHLPGINPKRVYLQDFAQHLKDHFNFVNKPVVLSNACISGLLGVIMAQRMIEQKQCRHVLVCGGDILSPFTLSGFKSFNALSPEPCKPFDAARVGINLGEAVATVLITSDVNLTGNHQTQLLSGASANDANHISGPSRSGDGLLQSVQQTLQGRDVIPGFISAHGTATPYNDEMESVAFERAGLSAVPVNSLKGYYGHTLGAAGVLETIISLEALHHNTLIKSAGYDTKGVSGDIKVIGETSQRALNSFLKTASGFGGCNAAALFIKA